MYVRIGTFNLYNLALPNIVYYEYMRKGKKVKDKYNKTSYLCKIDWIASQLDVMHADIVGFQEVFHKDALINAVSDSKLMYNAEVEVFERGSRHTPGLPGCVVGLASKHHIKDAFPIEKFPTNFLEHFPDQSYVKEFSRPVLRAELDVNNRSLIVYVVHLKSKRITVADGENENDPQIKAVGAVRSLWVRSMEAAALRWMLMEDRINNRKPIVVLGDLNDHVTSVTTTTILGDTYDPSDEEEYCSFHSTYTFQASRRLKDVFFTYRYNYEYECLDHILISNDLIGYGKGPRLGSLKYIDMYNDHLDEKDERRSDHGQVVASIELY